MENRGRKNWPRELGERGAAPILEVADVLKAMEAEENKEEVGNLEGLSVQDSQPVPADTPQEMEDQICEDTMEELLARCFLAGLKYRMGKSAPLPYDVGQFYARCLLPCVPEHRKLDMKKTKFKKFATFIEDINKSEGELIVKIQGKGKGCDVITAVNWDHPLVKKFEVTDERTSDEERSKGKSKAGPTIVETLSITEPLMPLIKACAPKTVTKGQLISPPQLREALTAYVKENNLKDGNRIKLDPLLAEMTKINESHADWNKVMQKIQSLGTATFVVELPDGRSLIYKIKAPLINLKVEKRMGNKKVTVISNCELLGIDAKELAHRAQVGVAASASVQQAAAPFSGHQIVLQGSQVPFVSSLLTTHYGMDKKYIIGYEVAKKKK